MNVPRHPVSPAQVNQGKRSMLALAAVCITAAFGGACSGGSSGANDGSANASTTTNAAITLATVKPVIDCSQLASVDLTDIGGAGSTIASATVTTTTVNGISVSLCAVKGTLAPSNTFEVALPVSTWTQRFAELGCGGLCGTLSDPTKQSSFSFSYNCPLVQQGHPDQPH